MDIGEFLNSLRPAGTVISFITFIGIVWWAYSGHRKKAYDEAANLPFDHDELPNETPPVRGDAQSERKAS